MQKPGSDPALVSLSFGQKAVNCMTGILDWLANNSTIVQAMTGIITALVWIIYLQILVSGFRRQRRSIILIHGAGNDNLDPRIFITNLGFESIYILEILLTVITREEQRERSITDRTEVAADALASPSDASLQGPLASGAWVDIGSIEDLLERMRRGNVQALDKELITEIVITVAAVTPATRGIVAARMDFTVHAESDKLRLQPRRLHAAQIRSFFGRRRFASRLAGTLDDDPRASRFRP